MNRLEQALQRTIAGYLSWALAPPAFFTSFPAGGGGEARGRVLKATGLKAGVPDLMLILDGRIYFVELKEPGERNKKDGGLTPAQRETIPLLKRAGCPVAVVYSLDDLKALIAGPWWPLQACIREAKPATERIERGIVQPRDWPESDHLGRKRRAKG